MGIKECCESYEKSRDELVDFTLSDDISRMYFSKL